MEAVNRWVCQPATKDGKPVAVQVNVQVRFHLYPGVWVSPSSARPTVGGQQQFSAIISGAANSVVKWSLDGSGCAASACASISADGLYTVPSTVSRVLRL